MNRFTYGDLQPEIARISGASGMSISDARVMAYTNLATQELMNEWDWPQLICWMRFKTTSCRINVPSEFDRILSLMVNGVPLPLQSPWFEFVGYGPAFPKVYGAASDYLDQTQLQQLEGVLDKEQVATFEEIPSDGTVYYPTVTCSASELVNGVRPYIIIQGYDQNGIWIRTLDVDGSGDYIDGVQLQLNGDATPFSTSSAQAFSQVTAILKPVTNGAVSLYVTNLVNNLVFLGQYAPYDTRPFYRRYSIPNLTNGTTYCILARLRKRYTPIYSTNDFLLIPNLAALSSMVQAVFFREAQNFQLYEQYKAVAVDIMKKEMTAYIGKQAQKPLITVNEGMGVRRDGNYIL